MTNKTTFDLKNQSIFTVSVDDTVAIILDGYRIDVLSGKARIQIAKTKIAAGPEIKGTPGEVTIRNLDEPLTPQGHKFEQQWER